jgi:Fe-S-cluster containining protein
MREFICQRCGACCRLEGYVYVSEADVKKLCSFLNIDEAAFTDKYTQLSKNRRLALKSRQDDSCVFLENNRCAVYDARPFQCEGFPMQWKLKKLADICPGFRYYSGAF